MLPHVGARIACWPTFAFAATCHFFVPTFGYADEASADWLHQRILSLSEGVLVRICRLIETAATEAIHSGQEHISLALLKDDLVTGSLVSIVDRRNRRVSAR